MDPIDHFTPKQLRLILLQMDVSQTQIARDTGLYKQNISETRRNIGRTNSKNKRVHPRAKAAIRKVVEKYFRKARKKYPELDATKFMPLDL